MNLIVNLVGLEEQNQVEKMQLKIDDITVLKKITNQVSSTTVDKIIFLVRISSVEKLKEYIGDIDIKCDIYFKILETDNEVEIASRLVPNDIIATYSSFRTINLVEYFQGNLDLKKSTVLLDGMKLYKRDIFNFSNCTKDAYVKFVSNDKSIDTNYMLYIHDTATDLTSDIKKIIVNDYKYNFIMIDDLKSIMQSSSAFSENKKLGYEYINQLFNQFNFDKALLEVERHANQDGYWAYFYLELLEGYGQELKFINFYKQNKKRLEQFEYTKTQKNIYSNLTKIFEAIDTSQPIVNADIKEYISEGNTDFSFIIDSVNSSKSKCMNISYLIKNLIVNEKLTSIQGIELIKQIESLDVSPYIKQKNLIDIFDYFTTKNQVLNMDHELLNLLIDVMHENSDLFYNGLKNRMERISNVMEITTRDGNIEILRTDIKKDEKRKVAVCISGLAKYNFEKNLELLNCFMTQNLDVDYFVQMWDIYEEYPGLSEFGNNKDFDWAKYYTNRFKRMQPTYIKRQANFEALMPQTSNMLFSKQYNEIKSKSYTKFLGENLKALKKYNYKSFIKKIQLEDSNYYSLNNKMIKYFEKQKVSSLLEDYVKSTNEKYDYVVNIDINTVLRAPLYKENFANLKNQMVYIQGDKETNQFGSSMTIATYQTAKYINGLWKLCKEFKNASPYLIQGYEVFDKNQDPMLLHLIASNIKIRTDIVKFGNPYINKKIRLPEFSQCVEQDVEKLEENKDELIQYFSEMERVLARSYDDNTKYQQIKKVKLINSYISDNGVVIELSIIGEKLKELLPEHFHLQGTSKLSLDSSIANPMVNKQGFEFLKHDQNEIVVRKEITDTDLFAGKEWSFVLLFHNITLSNFKIEFEPQKPLYELSKYGMKFVKFDKEFTIGISTKSFLLNK